MAALGRRVGGCCARRARSSIEETPRPVSLVFFTYRISAQVQYVTSECDAISNVLDDTSSLHALLQLAGWDGERHDDVEEPSFPHEFADKSIEPPYPAEPGTDHLWSDSVNVAIFSGHGNHGLLSWRNADKFGTCDLDMVPQLRLGYHAGHDANVGIFSASCVGYADDMFNAQPGQENDDPSYDYSCALGWSNTFQNLAFGDSPVVEPAMLSNWWLETGKTDETSNYEQWLTLMARPQEWDVVNQPVVFTTRRESEGMGIGNWRHWTANLPLARGLSAEYECGERWAWVHGTNTYVDEFANNEDNDVFDDACKPLPTFDGQHNPNLALCAGY